ncbi:MAG: response regulator [Burkholderiaceae bacterium]|jgi:CheY-like chemotaxis protein|nr:response regulator [Burkholderiaceae bacterium]
MAHILIVDDHADIRRLLSITLGKQYEILQADNGEAALDVVRRCHPAVVLLDVMMPGPMDGLQVLEAIKTNPHTADIVVAMVTARGQLADRDEAKRRGADAYFIKPFSPLQVVNWVRGKLR